MVLKWIGVLPTVVLLSACVTVPTGPSVMVLPPVGKPFEVFQADNALCREFAQQQAGVAPGRGTTDQTATAAIVGTLIGAGAGAAIGAAAGDPGAGAAAGAGGGLLIGSAVGAQASTTAATSLQQRYDNAYIQCMYAKGNPVPGVRPSTQAPYPPPPPR